MHATSRLLRLTHSLFPINFFSYVTYFLLSHFPFPTSDVLLLIPDRNPPERKLPRFWKPFGLPEGLARA